MRLFGLCAAIILYAWRLSATQAAEHFGQWSLEQPDDFVFALSFKRSTLLDDRAAASQLAFICNQRRKDVAVLMPLNGKFTSRHVAVPVVVQKIEEKPNRSDLMQRWENGPGYIFLEPPDEQEELATYLKDREAEGVKSVHFYFLSDLVAGTKVTEHVVIGLRGFSVAVAAFTNRCEQSQ
jgi:hypothetical protein